MIDDDPMKWAGALHEYVAAMRAAHRSEGTIRLHRHYLAQLAKHQRQPWTVTTRQLRQLLSRPGWSAETRKSARTVFRGFYRWGHGMGYIDDDPAVCLEPIRVPAGLPRPAPEHVLAAALLRADQRLTLMIMLAAFAGLRCCEIARVHSDDLVGDVLRVTGKGGKVREVPVLPRLLERLQLVDGWAFPNGHGTHLSPGHVSRLLSAGLPVGWTAHTLRHRMATQAYAGTRDLLAVSMVLGHSRPETTQRYVRLPDDALRRVVAAVDVA